MSYKDILRRRARKAVQCSALGRLTPYQIVGKPLVTEKAYKLVEQENTYTFRVHKDATKTDVKQSLKALYDVEMLSVRTVNVCSKGRANRKLVRRAYKKAYVTLSEGSKIELAG